MPRPRRAALHPLALSLLLITGCASDELQAPPDSPQGTLTVDASSDWAYASLLDASVVSIVDPAGSTAWDLGFNATRVMLNGGAAGPADVQGYCICRNAGATDPEIAAMTAAGELADFEAVTAADVPAAAAFESDALVPAITQWYTGSGAAAQAESGVTWLVRLADGTSFAKLRVVSLTGPTAEHAGEVALEYAVQPAAEAPFGPSQSVTLDASSPASLDLNTGSTAPGDAGWDLGLEGFVLRLNGGVSGSGTAGAVPSTEPFEAVTTASTDPRAYQVDAFAGIFGSHPWYRYNLTGENRIHPTFDVYLIRREDAVYKVQLIDYYSAAGDPRRITFRYARLGQ